MAFAFLEKLGISAGASLTDEQLTKINAALEKAELSQNQGVQLEKLVAAVNEKLDAQAQGFKTLEERLNAYEAAPATTPATPNVPPVEEEVPLSVVEQTNRAISQALYGK